jgi:Putative adhesin
LNGEITMTFMSTTGQSPVSAPGPSGPLRLTPGRWVALAIAVPVALALIGWTGYSLVASVARGSYPFSYTFPVHNGQVALNVSAGDITLSQAPASRIARLTGTVRYGLVRPSISEFTTSTSANVSLSCSANIGGDCGVSANLDVPAQTGVTLWSNGGDIAASGFSSGMTLWAAGGNVNVSNLAGALRLDTGGGDLTGNGLTGALQIDTEGGNVNAGNWAGSGTTRLDTGGGDFTIDGLTGNFQLATEGGNVNASGLTAATSATQSGGGDVTLTFTQIPKSVTITALGGNVNVILPPGDTKYDISTPGLSGGNVNIPPSLVDSKSPDTISIDSGGGDVTVSQG